ncbi:ATP-binding cassette domain-containing protein [Candidatus Peregrinibacteria bacterium]|nr:ATP-binding cassette domain-containing protein [Candidatus Peregrinibacteria bacterium]
MINFEKVTKRYKTKKVLDEVDLTIVDGEFVTLIGPSGAGKSTLVHTLIGAEKISSGNITVDGYRVSEMGDKEMQYYRRRIGIVFQDYRLLPQKTVAENVAYALEVCGVEHKQIRMRTNEVIKMVGLLEQAHHFPHQLSGGERQRTAIARALVHRPGLIIADEPTGNLDPQTALDIVKLFLDINKQGITILLTTHNKEIVNFLKKRVIKLDKGKVVGDKRSSEYI